MKMNGSTELPFSAAERRRNAAHVPDKIFNHIPESQAGVQRHKCAKCAYCQGRLDVKREIIAIRMKELQKELDDLPQQAYCVSHL